VQVTVQVVSGQNGYTTPELGQVPTTIAALTQGGGVGGVGGEGLGAALSSTDPGYVALQAPAGGDGTAQGLKFLYPYDGTVWPRGMLAPLLQWDWSFGDADSVRIDLNTTSGSFTWTGYFAKPAILASLPAAQQKFIRHPIPQDVWETATDTAGDVAADGTVDKLTVSVTLAKGGTAYGPINETWSVAPARLSGTIYYQSYGTNLAANYGQTSDGAMGTPSVFGAAVLSIRGGDPTPKLVSSHDNCQVCHSVAAKGARLVVQASTNGDGDTFDYELLTSGITNAQLSKGIVFPGYPALFPDGSMMLKPGSAVNPLSSAELQTLPTNSGADLAMTGLSAVALALGVPAFSPDGTKVVFNPQDTVAHPGRELVVMNFAKSTYTFSNPVVVSDDSATANADVRPTWPQFFPDSNSLIYEHQLRAGLDGNSGDGRTRKFAQGQIYWASALASAAVTPLNKLNGHNADGVTSYLPTLPGGSTLSCTADNSAVGANAGSDGDTTHTHDADYNYEPTVNPVSSGGYAWVVFTSRRMYGNEAKIPPFCSDPRGVDLHADMVTNTNVTSKKLWVAAIDINGNPASDASHPAFYLPAQELLAGNARGFWVLDPCKADNASCLTGDQCCGGYCEPNGAGGALECSNTLPNGACSDLQGGCATAADCCLETALCVNGFCAAPSL
jgi:hypothetical protein